MKKDWKYMLYIGLAFIIFLVVKLSSPKQHNWRVTYQHEDTDPYGTYALNTLLPTIFGEDINHSYETLYEIKDSLNRDGNLLIVCSDFRAEKEDTDALLKHVAAGGSALVSSDYFYGHLRDTLKLKVRDYLFKDGINLFAQEDTSALRGVTANIDTTKRFLFKRANIHNYFSEFDTTRTTVLAVNEINRPVAIRIQWGKGSLILSSTPMIFTNIYLLSEENHEFVSYLLSYLPKEEVVWTEYYHLGRLEASTPLRFILTNESLRWAYYISIIGLVFFMIFEMKRKQRIIPIIKPLANTTLEFVNTIGNLYFQHADHKNIAEKKINFFLEHVRTRYWLSTSKLNDDFIASLSRKSGVNEDIVKSLINTIQRIQQRQQISSDELMDLNKQLEKFTMGS